MKTETIVIKVGGVASQSLSQDFLDQVKAWKEAGKQVVLVHGGGFAINQLMEENQVPVKKINGLRVTSPSDMELVSKALLDMVGLDITAKLSATGLATYQFRDDLADLVEADYLDQATYGQVGEVSQIKLAPLEAKLAEEVLPILACLGYSKSGEVLNINADYLATAIATALSADQLILMTDVKGVLENGAVLDSLSLADIEEKIENEVITGGMIPKIQSAAATVEAGVGQVVIGDNLTTGTKIVKE